MTRNRSLQVIYIVLLIPFLVACASRAVAQAEKPAIPLTTPVDIQASPSQTPMPTSTPLPASPTAQASQASNHIEEKQDTGNQDIYRCCAGSSSPVDTIDESLREKYLAAEAETSYPKKDGNPRYHGMYMYADENAGFGFWLPRFYNTLVTLGI